MWCIKPENKEQRKIIGKWFDENNSIVPTSHFYSNSSYMKYYVFGKGKDNVFYAYPKGKVYTFEEFENEFIKGNIEQYEIF